MADQSKKQSPEFKATVAREALDQGKENLEALSEKHDVPVSLILKWATKLENHGPDIFAGQSETHSEGSDQTSDEVDTMEVEVSDQDIADAVDTGVMLDRLNYNRLIFWTVLGIVLVILFVESLRQMVQFNEQLTQQQVSEQSEYYQVNQLKKEARDKLNSFGVVDVENGIYRIPIDSAINNMVEQSNSNTQAGDD